MFVSIKKKTILLIALAIITAVSVCLIAYPIATASAAPKNGKTIVIDAGHGGVDGGVQGVNTKTKESDINLTIARALKAELESGGYTVVMTRKNSDGLYGLSSKNKKQKDMATRRDIIRGANADLVISIHQNFYPRSSVRGAQVFYAPGSEDGKQKAEAMQSVLCNSLGSRRNAMSGDYFILQCSKTPSLLVECGFLTTPSEEKQLVTASYQEKVAYAIFTGIHTILEG